jgi:hypothetical protein
MPLTSIESAFGHRSLARNGFQDLIQDPARVPHRPPPGASLSYETPNLRTVD